MTNDEFQKAISGSTVARIKGGDGEVINLTPSQVAQNNLVGSIPATTSVPVYKTDSGWSTAMKDSPTNAKVTLDETTGKITVEAPALALKNKTFKDSVGETLKTLSANYRLNPNYKYSTVDESGNDVEKSIQDIISDLNKPAQNEDGTYNKSSIEYMATAALGMERQKAAHAKNIKLSDEDVIRMNTLAIGLDVKPDSLQLISDLPEAAWLRNIDSYDSATGMARYDDIMENAYNKEKTSSEDMIRLWAALENYFEKGNFSDSDEYVKNVATARFLEATQPNMSWIRDVTENVRGFLDGIGGFATELGTALITGVEQVATGVLGLTDEYYEERGIESEPIYIARGGNQYASDMPMEKVDAKIGRVSFDEDGVPSYDYETISGSFENPRNGIERIRAIFKENQAVIRKDMEYLHASQASWDMAGYALTELAALISAGNVLSDALVSGVSTVAGKVLTAKTVSAAQSLAETGTALYASGTALGFGSTAAEAAQLVSGMKTIYDIAAATGKASTLLNFITKAVSSAKTTEFIIGVVGESIAEAIVGDPDRFVEVLKNKEVDTDTKTYLTETYIANALGWGVGLGVGKFLTKAGETTRGRAISANLSRRIFKVQNAVGDAFDRALLTIRRVEGDTLADQIESLYKKEGKYAKKQANALAANMKLREARAAIADLEPIKISGKSTDEINDALKNIETKIMELRSEEVALTSMQRQGADIVQGWLKDEGGGLKEATEDFYTKASKVAELEKASGDAFTSTKGAVTDLRTGKVLHLFSQTTTNYIKASEKIDFINAYVRKYEHAADVTKDVLRKIDAYKSELPELQMMVKTFLDNASDELRLAANNFIDADRKWWARFEDLRTSLGLMSADELAGMRGSGLWGTNGELYARTTRKADLSEYVVKHRDGASNVQTFSSYEQYMAGASGDFADPMGEMQIALYDAGSKQAYRSFARSHNALTGALTVKVGGEDVAFYNKMKKSLESSYFQSSEQFLKGMVEETQTGMVEEVIKNLKLKDQTYGDIVKSKAAMKTAVNHMEEKLTAVTSKNASGFITRLGVEDTNALWDDFYDVSVREMLEEGSDAVPTQARRFIYGQARELGIDISGIPDYSFSSSVEDVAKVDDKYSELVDKAKKYKTPERFEKMNNPIKGSEIWDEKPKGMFERDSRAVRVNMFPNDAVKGTGMTKQYLLNMFRDAYDQGITDIVPSYGSYTKEGTSFMDHLAEQGWVKATGGNGRKSYEIAPKIAEWEKTTPLLDIYNDAHNINPDTTQRMVKSTLLKSYDSVNRALAGAADTPDMVFEQQVKRLIMSRNDDIINDTRVQNALTERRRMMNVTRNELFYRQKEAEIKFLEEQYNITKEELSVAGGSTVQGYLERMTKKGTGQRAAIDELCRYYGLEGDQNAIEYFALSAFMDNEAKYKGMVREQIRKEITKAHPEFTNSQTTRITNILTDGIDTTIKEDFYDAYLTVKELNPAAVRNSDEKVMKEVDRIAKEIEGAEANRYTGEKNIIAMRNMQGQVEYYQTDPLLAGLMNFEYKPQRMNGLTQAIYNTNYLWAKLFRLGTTSINLKSMMNQAFRDPINMFIGGGAYRTTQACMDDIIDVAGDDVVAWIKTYEPEALGRLEKMSRETGEDIRKLAVEREFNVGRAIAPGATETSMYKSLATAKRARFNGLEDIYDDTLGDKTVRAIDKVGDTLGKGNEWRETTLRNLSYQNGMATALRRGYSLDQARTYATFIMNEATTNFTRMTNHLVSLKDTVPYFGSAINGSKSFFRLLSMDPVGVVGRLTGGLIIPAIALTAYSLKDEENRKIYKNIPEYQKEDALVFMVEGQIFSIPIPQELGAFVAPFRQMVEGMNDVSTNTFAELAWNDILGFSPLELSGFADLDFAKLEQSSPGFLDRIGTGIAKLWSQLAPAPLKSGLEIVTGVDPYTGKEIDKSYLDYDEDGNPIVKDYQSGELAKLLNNMFRSWGLSSSAPVVQNILANIIGQGSIDIADFLVSLGTQVPNGGWAFSATEQQLARGEGYNPFYVLGKRITDPITVDVYNEAQNAWKTEVARLYNMKSELLKSDAWSEYLQAKRSTKDPEKLKNINSSKKDLVSDYFNTVKTVINNLQANYGEEFTAAKYATVLSLMSMGEQTLDAGSYGEYLNKEEYKLTRAQAIQTMINLGFPSSSSVDVLGKFVTSAAGDIYIRTYSPLAILQLDDASGAALRSQSGKQHEAVIRSLINNSGIYELREKYYRDSDAAYDAKNYKEVERLKNEYDEKVFDVIAPYIRQYGPESVLTNDVVNYLEGYIFVPSEAMGKGKYYSSKTGLNKNEGYIKSYLKSVFNYGDNKIDE